MISTLVIFLILLGVAYVRMTPMDADRWHVPVPARTDQDYAGGAVRVLDGDAKTLARLDKALRALPRTRVLSGSVGAGRITYVTRSAVFGFPDATTIELSDGQIRMFARLRFGQSDLGVNRQRLERLLDAL